MPSSSVVIVNWNAADVLPACIESIRSQDLAEPPQIVLLDNASTDGSVEVLRELLNEDELIESPENLGFGRGNNVAAKRARGEFLLFLNPDTELVGSDCLSTLLASASEEEIGLVGPMLLNVDGSIQKSVGAFPSIRYGSIQGTGVDRLFSDEVCAHLSPLRWSQSWSRDVDWLKGAALVMRRSLFEDLGGFSESTFMYSEDSDLAFRCRGRGLRVRYETRAEVVHVDDHSSKKRWTESEKEELVARADMAFLREHYSLPHRLCIRAVLFAGFASRALVLRVLRRQGRSEVYYRMAKVVGSRPF
ncbi:MAG: glycosyltransferase family 2 protein [Thermoleophilaceae bacterium]|nr:glycosyltransferase family 2 protein [Thermoleophilaceae bacterium]